MCRRLGPSGEGGGGSYGLEYVGWVVDLGVVRFGERESVGVVRGEEMVCSCRVSIRSYPSLTVLMRRLCS